jgi:hypothetical protein
MSTQPKDWSPAAQVTCEVCGLVWATLVMGTCTYVVFWLDHSGWWYLLAILIMGCWSCKFLRSPAQIAADREDD